MDWNSLVSTVLNDVLPAAKSAVPYSGDIALVAAAVVAVAPTPKSGPLVSVWSVLNAVAFNWGNAKNASAS